MAKQGNVRESLIEAFCRMAEARPLKSISVGDLCEEVGISRNAFYTYFETKDSLLQSIIRADIYDPQAQLFPLFSAKEGAISARLLVKKVFEDILARREFYSGLVANNPEEDYARFLKEANAEALRFCMKSRGVPFEQDFDYIANFLAAGNCATLIKWIRSDFSVPVDTLAGWFLNWIGAAVQAAFNEPIPTA